MQSNFFKTLWVLYHVQQDRISYRELIEFLYNETPPADNNFLRYDYAPFIEEVIKFGPAQKNTPLFSVIIPTFNRHELLFKTVNAIAERSGISLDDFELIIVDNGSNDATKEVITILVGNLSRLVVTYAKLKNNHGPPFARNVGLIHSHGSLIAFCDDDSIVPQNWLSELKRELDADPEIMGVGGYKVPRSTKKRLGICHRFLWGHFLRPHVRTKDASFQNRCGTVSNVCYRKEIFEKLGGMNLYLMHVDSMELKARIYKSGLKLLYVPRMAEHFAFFSLTAYVQKLFPQSWDRYLLHVLHPDLQCNPTLLYFWKRTASDIRFIFTNKEKNQFFNWSLPNMIGFSFLSIATNFFLWFGKYWILFTKGDFVK